MVGLDQEIGVGKGARAAGHGPSSDAARQVLTGAGFNSATASGVPHHVWLVWVVTPFQGQHVAVPGEDDCLPPAVIYASWAITRWPTAMSSQLVGKPGAA